MQTYNDYRNRTIRSGLGAPAATVTVLVALYALVELTFSPNRFWPAFPLYFLMALIPLATWVASRLLALPHQPALLLSGDLAFTIALLSQIPQPTTSIEGAAASTSVKVLATAMFFPWAPPLQALSAATTIVFYWMAIVLAGRLGAPSIALFQVVLPFIAGGISVVGSITLDRARRALHDSVRRQSELETAQREQIARLRDRDQRLELLLEQMPAALWSTDTELRFTSIRGSILPTLGLDENPQRSITMQEFFGSEDPSLPPIAAHRAAVAGRSETYEFEWRDHVFLTHVEPLRDALGNITGAIGVAHDVTQQRRARIERDAMARVLEEDAMVSAALAELGRTLIVSMATRDALAERLADQICHSLRCDSATLLLRDPDSGEFVYGASFGLLPEAREVSRVLRFRPTDFPGFFRRIATGDVLRFQPGTEAELRWSALPKSMGISSAMYVALRRGRELIGYVAVHLHSDRETFANWQQRALHGMAHLAALALDNARLLAELERASALKSEFLATMSHELRTPLNAIIGYNDLMLDGEFGTITDEQRDTLEKVLQSAHELYQLISATLDLSRLEAGKLPVARASTDPRRLLAEIAGEARAVRRRGDVELHWHIPAELPTLRTDAAKLKVVIKNLISNAAKFTEEGSIAISASAKADGVEFVVRDTGCGIPADQLASIFEPFRQLDQSNTRSHGGVGLGLYIVRRFLDLLDGSIEVESRPGEGSTFRVWLPAAPTARRAPDDYDVATRP